VGLARKGTVTPGLSAIGGDVSKLLEALRAMLGSRGDRYGVLVHAASADRMLASAIERTELQFDAALTSTLADPQAGRMPEAGYCSAESSCSGVKCKRS
jgi:hypothetical protein